MLYSVIVRDVIKKRRKELDISQLDLAEMSGISLATVKNIERGKGNPSYETILRIMEVLGIEISFSIRSPFAD